MARTKHIRIKQVCELPNVFSFGDDNLSEKITEYFHTKGTFTLELGCGHGDYSIESAILNPDKNYVGIDMKAARIYIGAQKAIDLKLKNVVFVLVRAERIGEIFQQKSVDEIHILFPDPHVKRKSEPRRLVSIKFLEIYKSLLVKDGRVHLKTDNKMIFNYALNTLNNFGSKIYHSIDDLYGNGGEKLDNTVITKYEQHYLKQGRTIKYICFGF